MKSFVIPLLLVFSIILIPPVFGMPISNDKEPDILTITTDKEKYYENEMLNIACEMSVPVSYSTIWEIISLNDVIIIPNNLIHDNLIYNNLMFCYQVILDKELMDGTGYYKIKVSYDPYYDTSIAETTFEYYDEPEPINPLTIQTDKEEYFIDESIIVTGIITEIDWSADTTITYDITYSNNIIQTGNSNSLQNDGNFDFIIDISDWDIGSHTITVTIQDSTANITLYYHNIIDMTPESNYEKIMIQQDTDEQHDRKFSEQETMLESHGTKLDDHGSIMSNQDSMMYSYQDEIDIIKEEQTKQQGILDIIMGILEGILGTPPPIPADAPIILSITADDPDDLDDVYSVDDVIIIQFDSDTNTPGGTGMQKKQQVNNLFTFSEIPAQAYNGQWVTPDIFVITVKSVNNAEITIGETRVTPTGITPILPSDNTPDASYLTSPVLNGDWGILYPDGYTPEPVLKCGAGTIEIDGYCRVL